MPASVSSDHYYPDPKGSGSIYGKTIMLDDVQVIQSAETSVKKLVLKSRNAVAETVLYRYPTYEDSTLICCSTQSGYPVGYRFCGAGDYFVRDLSTEEIVAHVDAAIAESKILAKK